MIIVNRHHEWRPQFRPMLNCLESSNSRLSLFSYYCYHYHHHHHHHQHHHCYHYLLYFNFWMKFAKERDCKKNKTKQNKKHTKWTIPNFSATWGLIPPDTSKMIKLWRLIIPNACLQALIIRESLLVHGHVITKFSGMGRLPHFLSYRAPPTRALRARVELR